MIYNDDLTVSNIINMSDIELEMNQDFFENNFSKVNISDMNLRNIIRVIIRVMEYYGYSIINSRLAQKEGGGIGMFSEMGKSRISRIIQFLHHCKLVLLSKCFKQILVDIEHFNPTITGMENSNNSCYMDSVLQCLFATENKIISKYILKRNEKEKDILVKELNEINISINGLGHIRNCNNLRLILSEFKGPQEFHSNRMQDAGEFLMYLLSIFDLNTTIKEKETFVKDNSYISVSHNKYKSGPIVNVTNPPDNYNIESSLDFLEYTELDSKNLYKFKNRLYSNIIHKYKVTSASYIIFNINRLTSSSERNYSSVIFPPTIEINNRVLSLHAIILHKSSHYTCIFKNRGKWYFYDDMKNISRLDGIPDSCQKYCTLIFYS